MEKYEEKELFLSSEPMKVNMGPSHPAMHGTVRVIVHVDGEIIARSDTQVGFLHRGFEKECESHTWNQVFPYTDRLNYASPILNEIGYALAVEKLLGVDVTPRCKVLRTILGELGRIQDHLVCLAAMGMELGAFTPFLYLVKTRDWIYLLLEKITGQRVMHSFMRIGGMKFDVTEGFKDEVLALLPKIEVTIKDVESLLVKNRIFIDRTVDVGCLTPEQALSYGWTGPCLRSTGVDYDVRKAEPYLAYGDVEFDVPVGTNGDNYDRFQIRCEEMRQSMRIIRQAFDMLPDGPVMLDLPDVNLPGKDDVYTSIEGTIRHFMIVIKGGEVPAGEVYSSTEAANGELGFYLVSTGGGSPYKCRVRAPCFANTAALSEMIDGGFIADVVPTFGSINMIGGECDR
jgi:NADH-quinone oxidoreductase subunit D